MTALSDLRRREASIAIRHVRPEQPDLIAGVNDMGLSLAHRNVMSNFESRIVGCELVKQGLGIGIMAKEIADLTPSIECVASNTSCPTCRP